jgi:hypothetical protein
LIKKKYPATLVDLSIDKDGDAIPKGQAYAIVAEIQTVFFVNIEFHERKS